MAKRPNPMRVRKALTYTVPELALALRISTATVRSYVREGLPVMAQRKPMLFSGEMVQHFLRERFAKKRRPLQPDQLYCPGCKRGQKPLLMTADFTQFSAKTGNLSGLCSRCEGRCNRMIAAADYPQFAKVFIIEERAIKTP